MARKQKAKADLGAVLAEANSAAQVEKPKRKRRPASEPYTFTAEAIIEQRDTKGLSWRQVALNLELPGPSSARIAYGKLTGRSHTESNPVVNRAPKGSMTKGGKRVVELNWDDDTDQDEIIERLENSFITVRREYRGIDCSEDVHVKRVLRLSYDGKDHDGQLCVTVVQLVESDRRKVYVPGPTRTFAVADIANVR
jgi:hypothetical protein